MAARLRTAPELLDRAYNRPTVEQLSRLTAPRAMDEEQLDVRDPQRTGGGGLIISVLLSSLCYRLSSFRWKFDVWLAPVNIF